MRAKLYFLFAFLTLSGLISLTGCKEKKDSPKQATSEELSQMNKDFIKALIAKDAQAAANLYAEDAMILPPNEPLIQSRDSIQKYWQGAIDAGIVNGSVTTISTGSNGDLGYEIGRFELQIKDSTGKITIDKGKYTEILKRNSEGKWISIYGMWNSDSASGQ